LAPQHRQRYVSLFEGDEGGTVASVLFEKRVRTFKLLERELESLDPDAGVRVLGTIGGKKCYVFVTRFGSEYTAMAYLRVGKKLGGLISSRRFVGLGPLKEFLSQAAVGRWQAFVY
jgi:hypothetical protein